MATGDYVVTKADGSTVIRNDSTGTDKPTGSTGGTTSSSGSSSSSSGSSSSSSSSSPTTAEQKRYENIQQLASYDPAYKQTVSYQQATSQLEASGKVTPVAPSGALPAAYTVAPATTIVTTAPTMTTTQSYTPTGTTVKIGDTTYDYLGKVYNKPTDSYVDMLGRKDIESGAVITRPVYDTQTASYTLGEAESRQIILERKSATGETGYMFSPSASAAQKQAVIKKLESTGYIVREKNGQLEFVEKQYTGIAPRDNVPYVGDMGAGFEVFTGAGGMSTRYADAGGVGSIVRTRATGEVVTLTPSGGMSMNPYKETQPTVVQTTSGGMSVGSFKQTEPTSFKVGLSGAPLAQPEAPPVQTVTVVSLMRTKGSIVQEIGLSMVEHQPTGLSISQALSNMSSTSSTVNTTDSIGGTATLTPSLPAIGPSTSLKFVDMVQRKQDWLAGAKTAYQAIGPVIPITGLAGTALVAMNIRPSFDTGAAMANLNKDITLKMAAAPETQGQTYEQYLMHPKEEFKETVHQAALSARREGVQGMVDKGGRISTAFLSGASTAAGGMEQLSHTYGSTYEQEGGVGLVKSIYYTATPGIVQGLIEGREESVGLANIVFPTTSAFITGYGIGGGFIKPFLTTSGLAPSLAANAPKLGLALDTVAVSNPSTFWGITKTVAGSAAITGIEFTGWGAGMQVVTAGGMAAVAAPAEGADASILGGIGRGVTAMATEAPLAMKQALSPEGFLVTSIQGMGSKYLGSEASLAASKYGHTAQQYAGGVGTLAPFSFTSSASAGAGSQEVATSTLVGTAFGIGATTLGIGLEKAKAKVDIGFGRVDVPGGNGRLGEQNIVDVHAKVLIGGGTEGRTIGVGPLKTVIKPDTWKAWGFSIGDVKAPPNIPSRGVESTALSKFYGETGYGEGKIIPAELNAEGTAAKHGTGLRAGQAEAKLMASASPANVKGTVENVQKTAIASGMTAEEGNVLARLAGTDGSKIAGGAATSASVEGARVTRPIELRGYMGTEVKLSDIDVLATKSLKPKMAELEKKGWTAELVSETKYADVWKKPLGFLPDIYYNPAVEGGYKNLPITGWKESWKLTSPSQKEQLATESLARDARSQTISPQLTSIADYSTSSATSHAVTVPVKDVGPNYFRLEAPTTATEMFPTTPRETGYRPVPVTTIYSMPMSPIRPVAVDVSIMMAQVSGPKPIGLYGSYGYQSAGETGRSAAGDITVLSTKGQIYSSFESVGQVGRGEYARLEPKDPLKPKYIPDVGDLMRAATGATSRPTPTTISIGRPVIIMTGLGGVIDVSASSTGSVNTAYLGPQTHGPSVPPSAAEGSIAGVPEWAKTLMKSEVKVDVVKSTPPLGEAGKAKLEMSSLPFGGYLGGGGKPGLVLSPISGSSSSGYGKTPFKPIEPPPIEDEDNRDKSIIDTGPIIDGGSSWSNSFSYIGGSSVISSVTSSETSSESSSITSIFNMTSLPSSGILFGPAFASLGTGQGTGGQSATSAKTRLPGSVMDLLTVEMGSKRTGFKSQAPQMAVVTTRATGGTGRVGRPRSASPKAASTRGPGRPPKSEAEKAATKAAAIQRKESAQMSPRMKKQSSRLSGIRHLPIR